MTVESLRHLQCAEGYLEISMFPQAACEIWKVDIEDVFSGSVLGFHMRFCLATQNWKMGLSLARVMIKREPQNVAWWQALALCSRHAVSLALAEATLLRARELFPKNAFILFTLAGYASVQGRFSEAKRQLAESVSLDGSLSSIACSHEDFQQLWRFLGNLRLEVNEPL